MIGLTRSTSLGILAFVLIQIAGAVTAEERILSPTDWFRGSEPSFTADSRRVLLCGVDGFFHGVDCFEVFDPRQHVRQKSDEWPKNLAGTVALSGDRRWLAWPYHFERTGKTSPRYGVHLFQIDTTPGQPVRVSGPVCRWTTPAEDRGWELPVQTALSHDGDVLAIVHGNQKVGQMRLDVFSRKQLATTKPVELERPVVSIPIRPEQDHLPEDQPSNAAGTVYFPPLAIGLSSDGKTVAVGLDVRLGFVHPKDEKLNRQHRHDELHFHDATNGEPIAKWVFPETKHRDPLNGWHWLPDEERLLLIQSQTISLLRWRTREELWRMRLSEKQYGSRWAGAGIVSPDGALLIIVEGHSPSERARNGSFPSTDLRVRFVRTENGTLLDSTGLLPDRSYGTPDLSPDGRTLLTGWSPGNTYRRYRLWNLEEILQQREWGQPLNEP